MMKRRVSKGDEMTAQPQVQVTVDQVAAQAEKLSHQEKLELIQWLASIIAREVPGIVKTPGVVGGRARVDGTRIPVWTIIRARQLGISDREIIEDFPTLRFRDIEIASKYYALNHDEIEHDIYENEH